MVSRGLAGAVAIVSALAFSNAFVPSNNVAFMTKVNNMNEISCTGSEVRQHLNFIKNFFCVSKQNEVFFMSFMYRPE